MYLKTITSAIGAILISISCALHANNDQEQFSFAVDDVYSLTGGKLVIVGQVKTGEIKTGEMLAVKIEDKELNIKIEGMEIFAKTGQKDIVYKNDYVGLRVSGLERSQIKKGTIILKGKPE